MSMENMMGPGRVAKKLESATDKSTGGGPKVAAEGELTKEEKLAKRKEAGAVVLASLLAERGMTEADLEGVELDIYDKTDTNRDGLSGYNLSGTIRENGKLVKISCSFYEGKGGRIEQIRELAVDGNNMETGFHQSSHGPIPDYKKIEQSFDLLRKWGPVAKAMRDRDGKPFYRGY